MTDITVRQQLLECEARTWLREGYTTPEKIEELREFIGKKRGAAAVEQLIEEMRRQWGRRREWIE
ncbi:DUF7696 family protein [Azotobacter beijerinckii]|uniref:Antitoxin VbhA domain-containing protein n=1 Tax=Azotobacter beijerinckii TaxID=170623 RepID=A0A1I1A0F8_9GAMM|nr:hypothetical protein [Azotobacter beijerinckii]SFB30058.1 hypothetical protein SAMN04244571_02144 [Azotobacter beijerinckii]